MKPWECVGTQQECRLALRLLLERHPELDFLQYPRRSDLLATLGSDAQHEDNERLLYTASPEHLIPGPLATKVNKALDRLTSHRLSIAVRGSTQVGHENGALGFDTLKAVSNR
jgi:hypothetical protein